MKEIAFNTKKEYLTEQILGEFLNILFEGEKIIHNKKIKELGFIPDYYIPDKNLIIEFDGFHHYISNETVENDICKEHLIESVNMQLIRIPYFVQLSKRNIEILFKNMLNSYDIKNNFNNYKDGFIDKKAALPGKFSSLGLQRFDQFFSFLVNDRGQEGMDLVLDIHQSLLDKLIWEDKSFFECFPNTDSKSLTYNYQLLKNVYDAYVYTNEETKEECHILDLEWFKNYIEVILNIETGWSIDPNIDETNRYNKGELFPEEKLSSIPTIITQN